MAHSPPSVPVDLSSFDHRNHHHHSPSSSSSSTDDDPYSSYPSYPSSSSSTSASASRPLKFTSLPLARTAEPFRDYRGPLTLHRLFLFCWVGLVILLFLTLQDLLFPAHPERTDPGPWWARDWVGHILITPLVFYFVSFLGALFYSCDVDLDAVPPTREHVVWRIVTRGINKSCIDATIHRIRHEMARNSLFPYLIEVVTDTDRYVPKPCDDVVHLNVPQHYVPPNRTKFKARALHYACVASRVPDDAWVVHLDEETRPTSSGVKGIAHFITTAAQQPAGAHKWIGQGCMLYHRSWKRFPLLTLADMRRTGDDYGQFYLQARLGVSNVGLHGAFIVMRAGDEKRLGFDIGPDGSITEDAWWVFLAIQSGFRLRWVHGFLEEQATESVADFVKQRRRWMYGLQKTLWLNPSHLRYRMVFAAFMAMWLLAPLLAPVQFLYVVAIIVHDIGVPYYVRVLSLFNVAMIGYAYVVGWVVSLREGLHREFDAEDKALARERGELDMDVDGDVDVDVVDAKKRRDFDDEAIDLEDGGGTVKKRRRRRRLALWIAKWKRIGWWTAALCALIPVFQLLEGMALMLSFTARFSKVGRGFHVVEKSVFGTESKSKRDGDG